MYQKKEILHLALLGAWHVHAEKFICRLKNEKYQGKLEWDAVWDTDEQRGQKFAEELGCVFVKNYQEILENPRIDAVIIESETYLHAELIIKALKNKKQVFSDKIVCMNKKEGEQVQECLEKNPELLYVVSHESLGNPVFMKAKSIIKAGIIGNPISFYFRRAHGRAKDGSLRSDWLTPKIAGGGALIDLGVHGISLAMYLVGKPLKVNARMKSWMKGESEDSVYLMMEMEDGCLASVHVDLVTNYQEHYMEILGTEGILVVSGREGNEKLYLNSRFEPETEGHMELIAERNSMEDFYYPIERFVDVLIGKTDEKAIEDFNILNALEVVAVVEAAYLSASDDGDSKIVDDEWIHRN